MRNFFILLFLLLSFTAYTYAQDVNPNKLKKIVIDPGHGGNKPGAKGKKSLEKDLNLSVSLKLGKLINENLPSTEVVYTRKTDYDVDLIRRSQLANREKADIFISIHCNASPNHDACGTETFVMGLAKTQANIEAAKKENADILTEANYTEKYDGFDPNSPESNIFFALYQNAYLEQSLSLASKIQEQYSSNTKLFNRGVKQAPYLVLYKTSVPAILTEIGFISHSKEEAYLNTQEGQYEIAASIFRAICEYKNKLEGTTNPIPSIKSLIPHEAIKEDRIAREKERERKEEERCLQEQKRKALAEELERQTQEDKINDSLETNTNITKYNEEEVIYRVQFFTDKTKYSKEDKIFKCLDEIWMYKDNGLWKYTSGAFKDFELANEYRNKIKNKGYKDAFVVIFNKDERITLERAKEIENQSNK